MDYDSHIRSLVLEACRTLGGTLEAEDFKVELARTGGRGQISLNAALVVAARLKRSPRDLAEALAARLAQGEEVAWAQAAGAGFVNLNLQPSFWHKNLAAIRKAGEHWGRSDKGGGVKTLVEYVSANPTGPLHIGHGRGAVTGDVLASILEKTGFAVRREYYVNDAGAQVDDLARAAFLRYRQAGGEEGVTLPPGLYPGAYLKDVGRALHAAYGRRWQDGEEAMRQKTWLSEVRRFALSAMMRLIRKDLALLGITMDGFVHESELVAQGRVEEACKRLRKDGLLYEGILEAPKGGEGGSQRRSPQLLFRATRFGDDVDRPLTKDDDSWSYFASDIAYHADKLRRGYERLVNVWGADHAGYAARLKAVVSHFGGEAARLDIVLTSLVKLLRGGEAVKLSKRAGEVAGLRELIGKVGGDAIRFLMLTRRSDAPLDFDLATAVAQNRDNPLFYVQYAHARCCSVLRTAHDMGLADVVDSTPEVEEAALLTAEEELSLISWMASWPRTLWRAAMTLEAHRVPSYLIALAERFHILWHRGNKDSSMRFLHKSDTNLTLARLALVSGCRATLASGLKVMGVTPAEELRAGSDEEPPASDLQDAGSGRTRQGVS